jgi:hypothetical protein
MTETKSQEAPRSRRSTRRSFLTALVAKHDPIGRIVQRDTAGLDPEYREVLDAIHRPSR